MEGEGKSKLAIKMAKKLEKEMEKTFQDRQCKKGKHDWIKLTNKEKVWFMIFVYVNRKSHKLVCKNCSKEIYS